ncbi:uncharacterized protein TNCV_1458711 [Trichonephila clavipes]|nr:uncharacterized protein TNCV_1458711 [Trichonephila clavipes]
MRARAYCVHPGIRDHWVLRCISRRPDQAGGQFEPRHPVFKGSQASLVLIYRPTAASGNWYCDAQNYIQTESLNIHQCRQKISALQTVLEAKREELVDGALIYANSLCEELEISFEPPKTNQEETYIWRRK